MRQVIVKKNNLTQQISGNRIIFTAKDFNLSELPMRLTILRCPLKLDIVFGGELHLKFELSRELAESGHILHGAYHENDEVVAAISGGSLLMTGINPNKPILIAKVFETARICLIAEEPKLKEKGKGRKRR